MIAVGVGKALRSRRVGVALILLCLPMLSACTTIRKADDTLKGTLGWSRFRRKLPPARARRRRLARRDISCNQSSRC